MGKHANYLNGMRSWRLAVTLALGRTTVLAILKDAGIPMQPQAPSTEAAASTVDAARGLLWPCIPVLAYCPRWANIRGAAIPLVAGAGRPQPAAGWRHQIR